MEARELALKGKFDQYVSQSLVLHLGDLVSIDRCFAARFLNTQRPCKKLSLPCNKQKEKKKHLVRTSPGKCQQLVSENMLPRKSKDTASNAFFRS